MAKCAMGKDEHGDSRGNFMGSFIILNLDFFNFPFFFGVFTKFRGNLVELGAASSNAKNSRVPLEITLLESSPLDTCARPAWLRLPPPVFSRCGWTPPPPAVLGALPCRFIGCGDRDRRGSWWEECPKSSHFSMRR
ncbi:hypothetical protein NL676_002252 [Syzygium grande]|nr:hypothetical protein NL676_002252 [Syzygium grande]